ncbi:hypothetical protein [Henriciella barbarensis]|nr:hypothetical protein [Henriciella barbarensis]
MNNRANAALNACCPSVRRSVGEMRALKLQDAVAKINRSFVTGPAF